MPIIWNANLFQSSDFNRLISIVCFRSSVFDRLARPLIPAQ